MLYLFLSLAEEETETLTVPGSQDVECEAGK